MKKIYLPLLVSLSLVFSCSSLAAGALLTLEQGGIRLHFPTAEQVLASGLCSSVPEMKSFLEKMGLALPDKIHVVLVSQPLAAGYQAEIIPLYRIRIALEPPGPLEDGAVEPDPWAYRLFCGLASQAIFFSCHRIPAMGRKLMGAVISPNRILPPWVLDGICHLLWELYRGQPGSLSVSTLDGSIRHTLPWPGLDRISNHPRIWPGPESHRIWGRPFVRWLYRMYGWKPLLAFIRSHGGGVIPFEVDLKAEKVFGLGWDQLWAAFSAQARPAGSFSGAGGKSSASFQCLPATAGTRALAPPAAAAGNTASPCRAAKIVYTGSRPYLALGQKGQGMSGRDLVPGPAGVTALDGPVIGPAGQVAVAGCSAGNWDIWIYDGSWQKRVAAAGIQCHPDFGPQGLVFASDHGGSFKIYDSDWHLLSQCPGPALRPRDGHCYCLCPQGWTKVRLLPGLRQPPDNEQVGGQISSLAETGRLPGGRPYRAFSGMWPNYLAPDLFLDSNNVQLGLTTRAEDAAGRAGWDAGLRYAFSQQYTAWQLGGVFKPWSGRLTSYPLDYETDTGQVVAEARKEASLAWRISPELMVSLNGRHYSPLEASRQSFEEQNEYWLAGKWSWNSDWLQSWVQVELIESRGPSLSGWIQWRPGDQRQWEFSLFGGKSWGPALAGHNTFRIGGDITEGFFTRRTTRLFPVRGFATNCLESDQAFSARAELYLPLARISRGYGTFPVFWRRLQAGFFVDCGMAASRPAAEQMLVGTGLELVASLELAWDIDANLHLGVAWPVAQPDYLDQQGPVLLLQIGRPL